jgi:alkylated DNA repair dioxygenase AlkB
MEELFSIPRKFPAGFFYTDNFLSVDEEICLLAEIKKVELRTFIFQGHEAKRKVASFGYNYSFNNRSLSKGKPIPEKFNWLIEKISNQVKIPATDFAEFLITEYPPGAVINWHRDAFPFEIIAGVSLQSDCTFRLRPHEKEKQDRKAIVSLIVKRRSLYLMRGEVRSQWEHSTAPVVEKRYSVTLRTLVSSHLPLNHGRKNS